MVHINNNYNDMLKKVDGWIQRQTVYQSGIAATSRQREVYQEVTGYFIPSLLNWGYHDLALQFAEYLCSVQQKSGAWCALDKKTPYTFDTAQVIKGLLAVYPFYKKSRENIIRGCDWLMSRVNEDGRMTTPSTEYWGTDGACSELIHLYCLEPLREAAVLFEKPEYEKTVLKVLGYYKENYRHEIVDFSLLSHFQSYVLEALVDLGETELAQNAMERMARFQRKEGWIPGFKNGKWICSTGLFQLAVVWFKLGDFEHGDMAFKYACQLQNESGGWYGSYRDKRIGSGILCKKCEPTYFPKEEISWAVKYFLDALYYRRKEHFERQSADYLYRISKRDSKYKLIAETIEEVLKNERGGIVGDIGCGKGRFLRNLLEDTKGRVRLVGVDISSTVMERGNMPNMIETREGSILNIPYPNSYFDCVYTSEVLEHAMLIEHAIQELVRVVKPGGTIVIIDKNQECLGYRDMDECELWFQKEEIEGFLQKHGAECKEIQELDNHGRENGLFVAWIAKKYGL